MALKYADRVAESTVSTGTGDVFLAGPIDADHDSFANQFADTEMMPVVVFGGGKWMTFEGRYNSGANSITRINFRDSSTGAPISLSGTMTVMCAWGASDAAMTLSFGAPQSVNAGQQKQARSNAGVNDNNLLINDFRINQRGYVSAAALAAGVYGHDRWKAGAAGGDYSFTQLKSTTTVTIASGKSLIQVVEDANVPGGGVFVLSWQGTAQCRVGVNSNTPSGAYASSPILISGQTAGTTMSLEAGPGTFGFAKLEAGSVATPFVMKNSTDELNECLWYFERIVAGSTHAGYCVSATGAYVPIRFVLKRILPAVSINNLASFTLTNSGGTNLSVTASAGPFQASRNSALLAPSVASGLVAGNGTTLYDFAGTGTIDISAEL